MHELSGHSPQLSIAPQGRRDDDASPRRPTGMSQAETHWLGLAGRVCAVTGAASGIGLATVQALAAAGAAVALLDRQAEMQMTWPRTIGLRRTACRPWAWACDIADEAAVRAAAVAVRDALARSVYGLVNNAGLLRSGALDDGSLADWNQVLAASTSPGSCCARAPSGRHAARGPRRHRHMCLDLGAAPADPQRRLQRRARPACCC
jgi:NAD(P)-dependent dehydrogenase (short-subunit alcohol dehydrogenase family)